jgi:CcmD family protein
VSYLVAAYAVTGVTLGIYVVLLVRELRRLRGRSGA